MSENENKICAVCKNEAHEYREAIDGIVCADCDKLQKDFIETLKSNIPPIPYMAPKLIEPFPLSKLRNVHPPYIAQPKIGRNASCPCNSGKKYKNCCYSNT